MAQRGASSKRRSSTGGKPSHGGRARAGSEGPRAMRATTVRFGTDLWDMLDREAGLSGVSVAQYVREAALARLAYSAAWRGDPSPWGGAGDLQGREASA